MLKKEFLILLSACSPWRNEINLFVSNHVDVGPLQRKTNRSMSKTHTKYRKQIQNYELLDAFKTNMTFYRS